MPRPRGLTETLYPVARSSRHRRLLAIVGTQLGGPPAHSGTADYAAAPPWSAVFTPLPGDPIAEIHAVLQRPSPVTWVFAGDSFVAHEQPPGQYPSFVGRFSNHVRWGMRRLPDVVLGTGAAGLSVARLVADFDQLIGQFRPTVAFVVVGPREAEGGIGQLSRFEGSLTSLIRHCRQRGTIVVLNTPPRLPEADAVQLVDHLVYVEAVRALAAEHGIPLIDHWEHWEAAARTTGDIANWFDATRAVPGPSGHRQIAWLILTRLGLLAGDQDLQPAHDVPAEDEEAVAAS